MRSWLWDGAQRQFGWGLRYIGRYSSSNPGCQFLNHKQVARWLQAGTWWKAPQTQGTVPYGTGFHSNPIPLKSNGKFVRGREDGASLLYPQMGCWIMSVLWSRGLLGRCMPLEAHSNTASPATGFPALHVFDCNKQSNCLQITVESIQLWLFPSTPPLTTILQISIRPCCMLAVGDINCTNRGPSHSSTSILLSAKVLPSPQYILRTFPQQAVQ